MWRKATGGWTRHLGAVLLAAAIFLVGQTPGTAQAVSYDIWYLKVTFSGSGTYTATEVDNQGVEYSYTIDFNFSVASNQSILLVDSGNNLPEFTEPDELYVAHFDSITGNYAQKDNDCCILSSSCCPWEFLNGTVYKDPGDTAADVFQFQVWEDYLNHRYVFRIEAEPASLYCLPNPCCSEDPGTIQCGYGYLFGPLGDSQGDPIEFPISTSTFKTFKKFIQNYNYIMNAAALQKAGWAGFGADDPSAQLTWQGTVEIDVISHQHFGSNVSPAILNLLLTE